MAKNEKDQQKEKGKLSVSRRDFLVAGSAMIAGGALSASSISAAAQRPGSPGSSSTRPVVFGGVERLTPDGMTKYGKYLTSEIVCSSKYPQITAPAAKYDGCRGGGENAFFFEWSCITKPFVMDDEPEIDNDRDQFWLFYSGDHENPEFGAEVEVSVGEKGKKQIITEATYVWIPKGTKHSLVNFKTIRKPICFMTYFLGPEYSTSWVPADDSMYFANSKTPRKEMVELPPGLKPAKNLMEAYHADGRPFRNIESRMGEGMGMGAGRRMEFIPMVMSSTLGWPAKVSPGGMGGGMGGGTQHCYGAYSEPIHAHRESHQINVYLGSNRLDIQEFDAEIDIFLGKEHEKHTHNSCSVNHMPPGMPHMGDEPRRVDRPYRNFMFVIGPYMSNYYEAAAKDKVQLGDPAKMEVMISPGASDYVPPTKMEDWVWPYPKK